VRFGAGLSAGGSNVVDVGEGFGEASVVDGCSLQLVINNKTGKRIQMYINPLIN